MLGFSIELIRNKSNIPAEQLVGAFPGQDYFYFLRGFFCELPEPERREGLDRVVEVPEDFGECFFELFFCGVRVVVGELVFKVVVGGDEARVDSA